MSVVVSPDQRGNVGLGRLRATEFARLDRTGAVYLDYTGSALYPESLVTHHAEFLNNAILGNPHSDNSVSTTSTEIIEGARTAVLDFFDADPSVYTVCFTANATAAFKLVAESFPFSAASRCVLAADNHNSINGIREFAERAGAEVVYLPLDDDLRLDDVDIALRKVRAPSIFAFPAQSNFSGVQHPLELIEQYQRIGHAVVLDAAAFVPSNPLSLRNVRPDFVGVSFYKMFGYPTGIGALIAKKASLSALCRPWFSGGTVDFASVQHNIHQLLRGPEGYEDGTPNVIGAAAVPRGLSFLREIGMGRLRAHVRTLTRRTLAGLLEIFHSNGQAAVRLYGPTDTNARGATIAFNLLSASGPVRPYWEVERAAASVGISIRGGCFCNPGASEKAFQINARHFRECLTKLGPGRYTPARLSACLGGDTVGAIRASFGLATTAADVERLLEFVGGFRE